MQGIEQVVPGDDHQAEYQQNRARQPHQGSKGDHADANGPDHLHVDHRRRQLESPGKVDQGEFQHHQKQPALEQERRDIAFALILFAIQISRQASEQDKHRRTQVGQGTAEKQGRVGDLDIHRVSHLAVQEKRFAHVVQQHKQDNQPAQGIDGQQALV